MVTMPTNIFDGIKFCEQFLKRTFRGNFCQIWLKLARRIRYLTYCSRRTTDFARRIQGDPKGSSGGRCAQVRYKQSPKKHFCEFISKSNQQFQKRIFRNFLMSVYGAITPTTRAMFLEGSKFRVQFLKRITQETFP